MVSFVTGSRAYGFPREDSDIDLVILASERDALTLNEVGGGREAPDGGGFSIHFGGLNLVVFVDNEEGRKLYLQWKKVTQALLACGPVTRERAIEEFRRHKIGSNMSQATIQKSNAKEEF